MAKRKFTKAQRQSFAVGLNTARLGQRRARQAAARKGRAKRTERVRRAI